MSVSQSGTQNFCDLVGILYDRITIPTEIGNGDGRGWPGMAGDGREWTGMMAGDGREWPGTNGDGRRRPEIARDGRGWTRAD